MPSEAVAVAAHKREIPDSVLTPKSRGSCYSGFDTMGSRVSAA